MDDFHAEPDVSVVIHRPVWKVIASFAVALAVTAVPGWLVWNDLDRAQPEGFLTRATGLASDVAILAAVAVFTLLMATAFAWYPEFAVRKDGIRLPVARRPLKSSFWNLPDLGLYLWEEVVFCDWSHYQPGVLNVQVKSTRSLGKGLDDPPTRLFYRVPERHRAEVEKAIRARGKWIEH